MACGGVKATRHAFLNLILNGIGQMHTPAALSSKKEPLVPNVLDGRWSVSIFREEVVIDYSINDDYDDEDDGGAKIHP
jgi:hypothetical protein